MAATLNDLLGLGRPPAPRPECERQLLLFPTEALEPERLRSWLERGIGAPVNLVLTTNRASVLTFKRGAGGSYEVRLQRLFLDAPDDVLNALVAFVKRPTRPARERVVAYFSAHPEAQRRARRPAPPPGETPPAGRVHDLAAVFADLNGRYFDGSVRAAIGWGQPPGRPRAAEAHGRAIRFGSYVGGRDLIRIHPALDADWVPGYFVESIVYHEMLHAVIPIARDPGGRRVIHPPEF